MYIMRNICVYTTNRAEYSKLRPVLKLLQEDSEINLTLIVTGSHLLSQYGNSIEQIERDNIIVTEKIYTHIAGDNITKTVETIGLALLKLPSILERIKPDIILCGFDRFDMFPFAICGSLMNYCLVHVEGGEITGTLDEKIRHSISKLSNYHLVSTIEAKNNLIKMGEYSDKITVTGCPRYDELINLNEDNNIFNKYHVSKYNYLICCYHPVSSNIDLSIKLWEILINCLKKLKVNIVFITPNVDYGNQRLLDILKSANIEDNNNIKTYKHIDIDDFSLLLKYCNCLIGNSSAGIREACVFGTPVINIGTRQNFRVNDDLKNVHTMLDYNESELYEKIIYLSEKRYEPNFYFGDGNASTKIVKILKNIDFKNNEKVLSYVNE